MELTQLKLLRGRGTAGIAGGALLLLVLASGASVLARRAPDDGSSLDHGPRVTAPAGVRIKVQVLNASSTPGLAAAAVRFLRDRGFDVVESGNSSVKLDSTTVKDRTERGDFARLVALALGVARVTSERDSSRYVDVTVLLGADWVPPPHSFGR